MEIIHFINSIIIDDEPGSIANLAALLKNHPEVKILRTVEDPSTAVDTILDVRPDLLFLDIQMPGMSGFEVARALADVGFLPPVIFVTAFDHFAIEAIRHSAFDFLVKPVSPEELAAALSRFREQRQETPIREKYRRLIERSLAPRRLKISTAGGFTLIDPDEIVYIQADWNYSEIFFGKGKSEVCTLNIGAVLELLPEGSFFRINRSLIIHTKYLKKVSRKKREALLTKGEEEFILPIPLLNIRKLEAFLG